MKTNNKQVTTYFILFSLLLIEVIYAILQSNLQINGIAKISKNTWDIHFENIVVNPDSVSIGTGDTAATIDPNNDCKVDFSVTLSLPGDFYEFTVDVVNEGTIDGMIGTLTKTLKVNNVAVEEIPDYLTYSVTYDSGEEIIENQIIYYDSSLTYKVRLEFKSDIDELPEATTISTSLEPVFIQADSTAIEKLYTGILYRTAPPEIHIKIGDSIARTPEYYKSTQEETYNYYIKYEIVDNIITKAFACLDTTTTSEICYQGGIPPTDPSFAAINAENKRKARNDYYCEEQNTSYSCTGNDSDDYILLYNSGDIEWCNNKGRIRFSPNGVIYYDG